MNSSIDLDKLKKQSFSIALSDGLTEIYIGIVILLMVILVDNFVYVFLFVLLMVFWPYLAHKYKLKYVYPRIGYIRMQSQEDRHNRKIKNLMLGLPITIGVVIIVQLAFLSGNDDIYFRFLPILLGVIIFLFYRYIAVNSGQRSYYILAIGAFLYALLLNLGTFPETEWYPLIYEITIGSILIIAGIIKALEFIRKYPIIKEEVFNDTEKIEGENETETK